LISGTPFGIGRRRRLIGRRRQRRRRNGWQKLRGSQNLGLIFVVLF
jgi:hypothetical protein